MATGIRILWSMIHSIRQKHNDILCTYIDTNVIHWIYTYFYFPNHDLYYLNVGIEISVR